MFPGFENAEAELVSNGRNKILQISERPYSPALYIDAIISGWIMDEVFKKPKIYVNDNLNFWANMIRDETL